MLVSLSIQNVVLIERLQIDFAGGLCALTGETGAGKSILLDSLGLALGGRAESRLVRKGAEQAVVSAVFDLPAGHAMESLLAAQGIPRDESLFIRRNVSADGRSKAFVNDQPVSAGFLRDLGETLAEIHGQFETQGLLNPATHRRILDDYAGSAAETERAWQLWQGAHEAVEQLKREAQTARTDEEYLRTAIHDLDALSPEAGEEEKLTSLRERLMHREKVLEGLNVAYHALQAENDPVQKALAALDRVLDKAGEQAAQAVQALERGAAEIQEAISLIESASEDLQESEHDLESIDDRLHALKAQARKHDCAIDELAQKRDELAVRLNRIEHSDEALAAAMMAEDKARRTYEKAAKALSGMRKAAAQKLDKLVGEELAPLKLEKAKFVTNVEELPESDWGPHGIDRVQFLVATNPGADPGPLHKIASGGEMARFMLALKVVMAQGPAGPRTLVFDEVDAGIGGATADAVGERLARLAVGRQVLVVTHSPQVAARAGHHYIVRKDGAQELTTNVIALDGAQERREEIARMLAGATVTEEARAAAQKLLETGT